jgi:hypothetical protein
MTRTWRHSCSAVSSPPPRTAPRRRAPMRRGRPPPRRHPQRRALRRPVHARHRAHDRPRRGRGEAGDKAWRLHAGRNRGPMPSIGYRCEQAAAAASPCANTWAAASRRPMPASRGPVVHRAPPGHVGEPCPRRRLPPAEQLLRSRGEANDKRGLARRRGQVVPVRILARDTVRRVWWRLSELDERVEEIMGRLRAAGGDHPKRAAALEEYLQWHTPMRTSSSTDHATALAWLTPGMELALPTGDPESALAQLCPPRFILPVRGGTRTR